MSRPTRKLINTRRKYAKVMENMAISHHQVLRFVPAKTLSQFQNSIKKTFLSPSVQCNYMRSYTSAKVRFHPSRSYNHYGLWRIHLYWCSLYSKQSLGILYTAVYIICFVDLEKAFDNLELCDVLNMLVENNVPNGIITNSLAYETRRFKKQFWPVPASFQLFLCLFLDFPGFL